MESVEAQLSTEKGTAKTQKTKQEGGRPAQAPQFNSLAGGKQSRGVSREVGLQQKTGVNRKSKRKSAWASRDKRGMTAGWRWVVLNPSGFPLHPQRRTAYSNYSCAVSNPRTDAMPCSIEGVF